MSHFAIAQYEPIDDNLLVATKWEYAHQTVKGSSTKMNEAGNDFEYFVHFSYDYKFEENINGAYRKGVWILNQDKTEIYYRYRDVKWWKVVELTKEVLILEYAVEGKATFYYHFNRVEDEDAPFAKPANELPRVDVEEERLKFLQFKKKREARKNRPKPVYDPQREPEAIFIEIELIGGGFYGGIDPVLKNYVTINTEGRLIKEYQSVQKGLTKTKKDIPREELEQLAEYIVENNFFDFNNFYDCKSPDCYSRKLEKPTPIPLRLSVKYGDKKKMITVSICGFDGRSDRYVDYPKEIDFIIESIQRLAGA